MTTTLSGDLPSGDTDRAIPGLFEWDTRIGRAQFLILTCGSAVPQVLIMMHQAATKTTYSGMLEIAGVFAILVSLFATYRRLGDVGASPWLAILAIVPLANAVQFIWLAFKPGCAHDTWRGRPPAEHGSGLTATAILLAVSLVFGMAYAVSKLS